MNIICLIIALTVTPSHCRGVATTENQEDPPSRLTLTNRDFLFLSTKDFSENMNATMTNDRDHTIGDQNTTRMTVNENHVEEGPVAGADGESDRKSRGARSLAGSLLETDPHSSPPPPPSLVALLALDVIAALFALHALVALFFVLPN